MGQPPLQAAVLNSFFYVSPIGVIQISFYNYEKGLLHNWYCFFGCEHKPSQCFWRRFAGRVVFPVLASMVEPELFRKRRHCNALVSTPIPRPRLISRACRDSG